MEDRRKEAIIKARIILEMVKAYVHSRFPKTDREDPMNTIYARSHGIGLGINTNRVAIENRCEMIYLGRQPKGPSEEAAYLRMIKYKEEIKDHEFVSVND